jgi:hypothetical protein
MRVDQLQTMLEPYPFLQVTRYGVYRDSLGMDELANMVSDFFLGVRAAQDARQGLQIGRRLPLAAPAGGDKDGLPVDQGSNG